MQRSSFPSPHVNADPRSAYPLAWVFGFLLLALAFFFFFRGPEKRRDEKILSRDRSGKWNKNKKARELGQRREKIPGPGPHSPRYFFSGCFPLDWASLRRLCRKETKIYVNRGLANMNRVNESVEKNSPASRELRDLPVPTNGTPPCPCPTARVFGLPVLSTNTQIEAGEDHLPVFHYRL